LKLAGFEEWHAQKSPVSEFEAATPVPGVIVAHPSWSHHQLMSQSCIVPVNGTPAYAMTKTTSCTWCVKVGDVHMKQ